MKSLKQFGVLAIKSKNKYTKSLTNRIIATMVLKIILYTFFLIVLYFILERIASGKVWYGNELFYSLLSLFYRYMSLFFIGSWFLGCFIIIYLTLKKALSYVDKIVIASNELIDGERNKRIELPEELSLVENRLNQIKSEAILNLDKAKLSEERKNDLIVYLAHDIKTPLTSIIGYLSILNEANDMPKKQRLKYLDIVLEKSYKLENLINELFEITRFNSEKLILEKEIINLRLMFEQIKEEFYPLYSEHNKDIEIDISNDILLKADSEKMARVFNNLIKNAINYSNKDTIIKVKAQINEQLIITIKNEGKEISKESLNMIFEKFYRSDEARNTKTGGSGLGLAIAKEIVLLHEGKIEAQSIQGITTFTIFLPY